MVFLLKAYQNFSKQQKIFDSVHNKCGLTKNGQEMDKEWTKNGQEKDNRQWTMDNGQWTMDNGQNGRGRGLWMNDITVQNRLKTNGLSIICP